MDESGRCGRVRSGFALFMKRLGLFSPAAAVWLLIASSVSSAAVYTLDVVTYGHAVSDGFADDRVPIQKTIDAVNTYLSTHSSDTGMVTFPPGVFLVSVNEDPNWRWVDPSWQPPVDVSVACLFMYKNITLQGATTGIGSTIRVAVPPQLRVPPYEAIILFPSPAERLQDIDAWFAKGDATGFKMYDLILDGDSPNNRVDLVPVATADYAVDTTRLRAALALWHGTGIDIQRVTFQNFTTAQTVFFGNPTTPGYGPLTGALSNCKFLNIGGGNTYFNGSWAVHDYDVSTLYVTTRPGDSFTISNSLFETRTDTTFSSNFYGVRAAIELHGPNQTLTGNTVKRFASGVNVVGDQDIYNTQVYDGNTFIDMGSGFSIWSVPDHGVRNTRITNNSITINPDLWISAERQTRSLGITPAVQGGLSGIAFAVLSRPQYVDNLQITSNTFTHLAQTPDGLSDLPESGCLHGEWGIAITIGAGDEETAPDNWARDLHVTNLFIQGNTIISPLSNGIFLNSDVQGATIRGNRIQDPGSSPFNPYGTVPCDPNPTHLQYMDSKYTAALRVGGGENVPCGPVCPPAPAAQNISVPGTGNTPNIFTKTPGRTTMGFGIYTDRATSSAWWVAGMNDFLTSQVTGIPYYQDTPRMGVINCDYASGQYTPPCFGWSLRAQ